MLRCIAVTLFVAVTASVASHGTIATGNIEAPIPYYPCNTTLRGLKTINLIEQSGTWFDVALTIPFTSQIDPKTMQQVIRATIGCSRVRFDLVNANNLGVTQDIVNRQPINDTSQYPPGTQIINGNEARYDIPTRVANAAILNDAHWILETFIKQYYDLSRYKEGIGSFDADAYTIATDYKDWAVWYRCAAPPTGQQMAQWGIWSRSPKPVNAVQKLAFKALARLAGVDFAFTDYLYDFPQDMCF